MKSSNEPKISLKYDGSGLFTMRIPHYALINGEPHILIGVSYIEGVATYADRYNNPAFSKLVHLNIKDSNLLIDAEEISKEEYLRMRGHGECGIVTIYDRIMTGKENPLPPFEKLPKYAREVLAAGIKSLYGDSLAEDGLYLCRVSVYDEKYKEGKEGREVEYDTIFNEGKVYKVENGKATCEFNRAVPVTKEVVKRHFSKIKE